MTDSKANFIFISHPNYSAESLFLQLRERGILVRHFNQPIIDNHLRVSIGKEEDMDRFLETVKEIIKC
jgi:histidinol-phosphate aminotransferase